MRVFAGAETIAATGFPVIACTSVSIKLRGQNNAVCEYMSLLPRDETAADTTAELGCGPVAARVL